MNAADLARQFRLLPALRGEVALEDQPGLPEFLLMRGELCARYWPHRMALEEGRLGFGAPRYEVVLVWPFRHLARFRALALEGPLPEGPVCAIGEDGIDDAKRAIKDYFAVCDALLAAREADGRVDEDAVAACRRAFEACVRATGTAAIYGGG